jgi:hypothetical protein
MKRIFCVIAALFLYGCQKSDVEKCVDAQMESYDEDQMKKTIEEKSESTRKEFRAKMYEHCLALSARPKF